MLTYVAPFRLYFPFSVFERNSSWCPPCYSISPSISISFPYLHRLFMCMLFHIYKVLVHFLFFTLPHTLFPCLHHKYLLSFESNNGFMFILHFLACSQMAGRGLPRYLSKIEGLLGKLRTRVMLANYLYTVKAKTI